MVSASDEHYAASYVLLALFLINGGFVAQQSKRGLTVLFLCAGLVLVISVLWLVKQRMRHTQSRVEKLDMPLPELALQQMDGTPIAQSEWRGRVTVLDFWGTWCPPCVQEMPVLSGIAAGYSHDPRVKFLLVNPEMYADSPGKIRAFLQKQHLAIPVALDPAHTFFKIGPMQFPAVLVIDRRGHIRYQANGYSGADRTRGELRNEMDELLAQ